MFLRVKKVIDNHKELCAYLGLQVKGKLYWLHSIAQNPRRKKTLELKQQILLMDRREEEKEGGREEEENQGVAVENEMKEKG